MRAVMLVPWAIPTVVAAQMWKWMLDDIVRRRQRRRRPARTSSSHSHAWISDPSTALASVCAVDIWKTTPFVALLLLAGLQVIPRDLYEAADVDGASQLQQFWQITLPLLAPAILVTLIFRTLDALRVFDVFYVFFGNRLDTQTMAIYDQSTIVGDGHVGYGAAISVAIFLIIALFVVIYVTFIAGDGASERRCGNRRRRSPGPISRAARCDEPLGRSSQGVPFYLLIAIIFVYALFPFYWALRSSFTPDDELFSTPLQYFPTHPTLDNYQRGASSRDFFRHALINSTIVAGSVTLLSLAIGSLAAYALGRFRFRGRSFVMYLMLSMTIFPQIAILGALYTMINSTFHSLQHARRADLHLPDLHAAVHGLGADELHAGAAAAISRRRPTSTARRRSRSSTRCCCR